MTDYLKGTEKQENALLEQAKRLERALAALAVRGNGEGPERAAEQMEHREESWNGGEEADRGPAEDFLLSQVQRQDKNQQLPLLGQLRQMDGTWGRMEEAGNMGWKEPAAQMIERTPGRNPSTLPAAGRLSAADALLSGTQRESHPAFRQPSPLPSGGALTWAEQADRAFRRDSRRYDSGFYLY